MDVDQDRWHARLMAWGAFSCERPGLGLENPGEPQYRISYCEKDAMRVDRCLAGMRDRWAMGYFAVRSYYLRRWWDASIPGYKFLAEALNRKHKANWTRLVNQAFFPKDYGRAATEAAAQYVLEKTITLMDASEKTHRKAKALNVA